MAHPDWRAVLRRIATSHLLASTQPVMYAALVQARICPRCGRTDVHRSHRRSFAERIIFPFIFLRPFRCDDCNHRYLDFTFTHKVVVDDVEDHQDAPKRRRRKREPRPVGE